MLGESHVRPTTEEKEMRIIARRSITAIKEIKMGEKYCLSNIGMRRPGSGLSASLMVQIIGSKATRSIKKAETIKIGDIDSSDEKKS